MSEYNDVFVFSCPQPGFDAGDSEYPALPPDLDQSGTSIAHLQAPNSGALLYDTDLRVDVDSAEPPCEWQWQTGPPIRYGQISSYSVPSHSHAPITSCSAPSRACGVCHERYQTDTALHRHAVEAQHQAYKCKCGTGFNKASALKRHIETKDAPKTFACTLCYDKFNRKDKLRDHCRHYHKVTDQGLQVLFGLQEVKPRAGAASRRRRAAVPRIAASSGSSVSPVHAPAHVSAGPSAQPRAASTGQQHVDLLAGLSVPAGPPATTGTLQVADNSFVPTSQFVLSADAFHVDPALGEDFSDLFDSFIGNETWATGFDNFNF